jgi:hypothetical protein
MTDIYLDAALAGAPDARDHVANLIDAGQQVTFVGSGTEPDATVFPGVRTDPRPPDKPPRGSWFVTAEPARCAERIAGLRTLLISPRTGRSPVAGPRCDQIARDLAAAVLDILAHDAMGT